MTSATRPQPRVYFFRDGRELTEHPANGCPMLGVGVFSGRLGSAVCFSSVTVRTTLDDTVTERDFDGPVSFKIWAPGTKPVWFGLGSVESVETDAQRRAEAARF